MLVRGSVLSSSKLNLQGTAKYKKPFATTSPRKSLVVPENNINNNQKLSFLGKKIKEVIEKPLTLIYMADTHKSYDMMAKIKTVVDTYKKLSDQSLVVHAGDYAMGSKGIEDQVELLNKIGIELATLGNHEFFSGTDTLAKALQNSEFQTVISNLEVPKTNPISGLFDNKKLVKTLIKEIDGKKYAFVGAVSGNINGDAYNTSGVKAINAMQALKDEIPKLEKQGINRIILISHLGYKYDKALAKCLPGIDVIVGGHTHLALPGIKEDVNLIRSQRNKEPVLLLHAGAYGEAVGVSHLVFNDKGILNISDQKHKIDTWFISKLLRLLGINRHKKIETTKNFLVEVASYPEDKAIAEVVKKHKSEMKKLTRISKPVKGDWPIWKVSNVGGLTADAVRDLTGADASIVQPGAIRRGLKKGIVYEEYIKNHVLPFNTNIVKVEISGKDILKALHKGAKCAGYHAKPGLLQVSGIKYAVNMKRHEDARVEDVEIFNGKTYETLDLRKNYTIAFDKYLLSGGDSLVSLKQGKVIEEFKEDTYSTALIKYIKKLKENNEPLHQDFSDRIEIRNRSKVAGFISNILNLLGFKLKSRIDKFVFKG